MEEDVVQYHADKIEHVLRSSYRVSHCRDTERAGVRLTTQGTTTIQEMPVGEAMIRGTSLDISRHVFPDRCGYHIKLNRGVMVLYLNTMMVTQGNLIRTVLFGTSTTHTKPSFLARIRPVTRMTEMRGPAMSRQEFHYAISSQRRILISRTCGSICSIIPFEQFPTTNYPSHHAHWEVEESQNHVSIAKRIPYFYYRHFLLPHTCLSAYKNYLGKKSLVARNDTDCCALRNKLLSRKLSL